LESRQISFSVVDLTDSIKDAKTARMQQAFVLEYGFAVATATQSAVGANV
jgi:hypothetical protein